MKILIIHGPNLNMLGKREPEIYGADTLEDVNAAIENLAAELGVEVSFFQSNAEGDIVAKIQQSGSEFDAIMINPGAYTHTSIAIRDAILSSGLPIAEVHISNVHKREEFRHKSYVSGVALGVVTGFGIDSYFLGLRGLVSHLSK